MTFDCFFFFKQKTAYEMRISDWSSDVCSSDLGNVDCRFAADEHDTAPASGCHPGQIVPRRANPAHDVELAQVQPVIVGNGGDVVDAAILADMRGLDDVDVDVGFWVRWGQPRYALCRTPLRRRPRDEGFRHRSADLH